MALSSTADVAQRLSERDRFDPHAIEEIDSKHKIRISNIGGRYLVFDVTDVARLRRQHNMCAILVGITPQAPNQNVFSSLPLELTADEVRWLVHERRAAYVADDLLAHLTSLAQPAVRRAYLQSVQQQRQAAQLLADEVAAQRERRGAEIRANNVAKCATRKGKKAESKKAASKSASSCESVVEKEKGNRANDTEVEEYGRAESQSVIEIAEAPVSVTDPADLHKVVPTATDGVNAGNDLDLQLSFCTEKDTHRETTGSFDGLAEANAKQSLRDGQTMTVHHKQDQGAETATLSTESEHQTETRGECQKKKATSSTAVSALVQITPTTSDGLVGDDEADNDAKTVAPAAWSSLPPAALSAASLRAHLASRGYYTTPGLRFGGTLSVYPGDPFRYHAHFVATTYGWNEPIPLLDVVSQGRLATGVKKSLLISGSKPVEHSCVGGEAGVRAFSLEWAAI
ncbi:tRNA-splicing endonuclease subunit [Sporothrix epigloea]|uniref:tRNA-intron lyase n=1 Tax=Sporothrix epigloea TaxID=1892477 RepID=A0ABP0DEN9_9PEZI